MKRLARSTLLLLVTLSLLGAIVTPAIAQDLLTNFRCGNLIITEGLEKLQVLANCGEPVASERSYVERYGEVEKLVYGPDAGYYYVMYFFVGKLIKVESIRQL
jgi:hypothetical protein